MFGRELSFDAAKRFTSLYEKSTWRWLGKGKMKK